MGMEFVRIPKGRDINTEDGFQNSPFILDDNGVPEYRRFGKQNIQKPTTALPVRGVVKTGFKPDIPLYTIVETIHGKLQNLKTDGTIGTGTSERDERRKFTYDKTATPTHKYYINDVLQAYVGTIPDPAKDMELGVHPTIGYTKDRIEYRSFFEVREKIK